jgi:hypothetical protein
MLGPGQDDAVRRWSMRDARVSLCLKRVPDGLPACLRVSICIDDDSKPVRAGRPQFRVEHSEQLIDTVLALHLEHFRHMVLLAKTLDYGAVVLSFHPDQA